MFKLFFTVILTLTFSVAPLFAEDKAAAADPHAGHDHAKPVAEAKPEAKTEKPAANPVDIAEKAVAPVMTSAQTGSYGIGYSLGQNAAMFADAIDFDSLVAGLKDAIKGQKPKVTQEAFKAALDEMQKAMQAKAGESSKVNIEAGKKFMAENATKEGVKTTASGLQYKITTEGTGKSPTATSTVRIHYKGTLLDGTKFDSSYDRNEPLEIGLNQVVPGWTEGVQLLKEGAKATFWIPSDLGYGNEDSGPIPAGSTLIFEVELLEVK